MNAQKNILMVTTSANALPNGRKTGVWLEEIAVPYLILEKAGMTITVASPKGGAIPLIRTALMKLLLQNGQASWSC